MAAWAALSDRHKKRGKKNRSPGKCQGSDQAGCLLLTDHRQLFLGLDACGVAFAVTANDHDLAVGRLAVNTMHLPVAPSRTIEKSANAGIAIAAIPSATRLQTRASPSRLLSSGSYGVITSSNKSRSWNKKNID
jgi:hypothetical protein